MKRAWLVLTALCCVGNVILTGVHWYNGDQATWWIWGAAILFSIDVFFGCIKELTT